jgi:hypothetical protein
MIWSYPPHQKTEKKFLTCKRRRKIKGRKIKGRKTKGRKIKERKIKGKKI